MKLKPPESSFINPLHEVKGTSKEARASFYERAKDKIKYITEEEARKWFEEATGQKCDPNVPITAAVFSNTIRSKHGSRKWLNNLEIIVNEDAFNIDGEDYSDLKPFVIEHEIYESWLRVKKGLGPEMERHKRHFLAKRRQYLLAEQQGLGDKLLEWHTKRIPGQKDDHEYALKVAKKQLGHLKSKKQEGEIKY